MDNDSKEEIKKMCSRSVKSRLFTLKKDSECDLGILCDVLGKELFAMVETGRRKEIFRLLGITSNVKIPWDDNSLEDCECIQHPDFFGFPIAQGDLTGIYHGHRSDIFGVKQGEFIGQYWSLDYVVCNPNCARKFYYFIGKLIFIQLCKKFNIVLNNIFKHVIGEKEEKCSEKIQPFLDEIIGNYYKEL
jgi:hypothetical protein